MTSFTGLGSVNGPLWTTTSNNSNNLTWQNIVQNSIPTRTHLSDADSYFMDVMAEEVKQQFEEHVQFHIHAETNFTKLSMMRQAPMLALGIAAGTIGRASSVFSEYTKNARAFGSSELSLPEKLLLLDVVAEECRHLKKPSQRFSVTIPRYMTMDESLDVKDERAKRAAERTSKVSPGPSRSRRTKTR